MNKIVLLAAGIRNIVYFVGIWIIVEYLDHFSFGCYYIEINQVLKSMYGN